MHQNIAFKMGHVLIQVENLEEAVHQYRKMGFRVTPGGPVGKMNNAMIYLKDGSFLELFCTNRGGITNSILKIMVKIIGLKDPTYAKRLKRYLPGQAGLKDYALDSVPPDQYLNKVKKIRENGLNVSEPKPKSRIEQHGVKLEWKLCWPQNVELPFLMSPYQPEIPVDEAAIEHPNGALGIHKIQISTCHWDSVYQDYVLLLGLEPKINQNQMGRSCIFQIQNTRIHLTEGQKNEIVNIVLTADSQSETEGEFERMPPFITL